MASRRDESPKTWFRSNRVFRVDGDWFIHTREGIAVGPYSDRFAADVDAEVLKSLLVGSIDAEAAQIINEFMLGGCRNFAGKKTLAVEFDSAEVANLLEDEEKKYSFDDIRQLS